MTKTKRLNSGQAVQIVAAISARIEAGQTLTQACRAGRLSAPSYYRWRAKLRRESGAPNIRTSEVILAAAKTLFLKSGYSVSLDAIAKAAGVTRQTLYNQFGGKEHLFSAVAASVYEGLANRVLVIRRDADFISVMLAYGRQFMRIALDPENIRLLRISLAAESEIPNLTRLAYSYRAAHLVPTVTDDIARYLRKQAENGLIDAVDPLIAAEMFMGALAGHARNRALVGAIYDTPERLEQVLHVTVTVFARGLGYQGELRAMDHQRRRD